MHPFRFALVILVMVWSDLLLASPSPRDGAVQLAEVKSLNDEHVGHVVPGRRAVRRFEITNTSSAPLKVSIGGKTCASLDVGIKPEEIGPGQISAVTVSMVGLEAEFDQTQEVTIEIATLDGLSKQVFTAAVTYTPNVVVVVKPECVARDVRVDEVMSTVLYVRSTGGDRPKINRVMSPLTWLKVVKSEPHPFETGIVLVTLAGKAPAPGRYIGKLEVHVVDQAEPVKVDLNVRVGSAVRPSPAGYVVSGELSGDVELLELFGTRERLADVKLRCELAGAVTQIVAEGATDHWDADIYVRRYTLKFDPAVFKDQTKRVRMLIESQGEVVGEVWLHSFAKPGST